MKVITIAREYGAGGGEVASRLADALGWEVLDRELLHRAAEVEHVSDAELERLDERAVATADRFRLHPPHQKYLHGLIAGSPPGGRARQCDFRRSRRRRLLGEMPEAFHLRLVAPRAVACRADGEAARVVAGSGLRRRLEVDRIRELFTRYFFGDAATATRPVRPGGQHGSRAAGRRGGRGFRHCPPWSRRGQGPSGGPPSVDPFARTRGRRNSVCDCLGANGLECASTTANCWKRRPFAWAFPRRRWRRSTSSQPASSNVFAPAAFVSDTSRRLRRSCENWPSAAT